MLSDLTYKVIVIDDDEDLYEDYTEFIETHLQSEGYLLNHKWFEKLSDLDDNIINDVDLFLIDLKFGSENKGPEFIKRIRENLFTDILFYSSDAKAIQELKKSGEYQGVFFAVRDEHNEQILPMLDSLINKMAMRANTPLALRGTVLGCVAELDNLIKEKIELLEKKLNKDQLKEALDMGIKKFHEFYELNSDRLAEFWGCNFHNGIRAFEEVKSEYSAKSLFELAETSKITDSSKNFFILSSMYKIIYERDALYNDFKHFSDLLTDRNIFAHVKEEKNEDGLYQFKKLNGTEYVVLTKTYCEDLRKSIIQYYNAISRIGE